MANPRVQGSELHTTTNPQDASASEPAVTQDTSTSNPTIPVVSQDPLIQPHALAQSSSPNEPTKSPIQ
jgi:hypothetical protein